MPRILLRCVLRSGDVSVVQLLIDMKLDLVQPDNDDKIFLHVAAENNQAEILQKFSTKLLCTFTVSLHFSPQCRA